MAGTLTNTSPTSFILMMKALSWRSMPGWPWTSNRADPPMHRRCSLHPQWLARCAQLQMKTPALRRKSSFDMPQSCAKAIEIDLITPATANQSSPPLLERVGRNDLGAMEQCIAQFSGLVWNLVKRRVPSHSVAEDLVQEIFTEIWKSAARFDPAQGSEVTFIGMIARRRVIDWTRKQMRMPAIEALPDNFDEVADSTSTADSMDFDAEQLAQVVAALPAQTRRLFHLHFDQGLTQHEIAELNGMPLGTVKTLLRRGLIEAKSMLQRKEKSHPVPNS